MDDFDTDFLAVELSTVWATVIVGTTYLPPWRPFLPFTYMYELVNNTVPTFNLGDLNNKYNYLNTLIKSGDLTTSDHIPIILKVST